MFPPKMGEGVSALRAGTVQAGFATGVAAGACARTTTTLEEAAGLQTTPWADTVRWARAAFWASIFGCCCGVEGGREGKAAGGLRTPGLFLRISKKIVFRDRDGPGTISSGTISSGEEGRGGLRRRGMRDVRGVEYIDVQSCYLGCVIL